MNIKKLYNTYLPHDNFISASVCHRRSVCIRLGFEDLCEELERLMCGGTYWRLVSRGDTQEGRGGGLGRAAFYSDSNAGIFISLCTLHYNQHIFLKAIFP